MVGGADPRVVFRVDFGRALVNTFRDEGRPPVRERVQSLYRDLHMFGRFIISCPREASGSVFFACRNGCWAEACAMPERNGTLGTGLSVLFSIDHNRLW